MSQIDKFFFSKAVFLSGIVIMYTTLNDSGATLKGHDMTTDSHLGELFKQHKSKDEIWKAILNGLKTATSN
jgi:hypothetical protein